MVNEPSEKEDLMVIYGFGNIQTMTNNIFYQADVSRGDGTDFSFHVFDAETVEQVAEYKGKFLLVILETYV